MGQLARVLDKGISEAGGRERERGERDQSVPELEMASRI